MNDHNILPTAAALPLAMNRTAGVTASKTIGSQDSDVKYIDRHAVRLLITNAATSEIALIFVQKCNYHKLPGGEVEADEDHSFAAMREAEEEIGCKIKILGLDQGKGIEHENCLATTEEWRNDLHQISYAYTAVVVEDKGQVALTEEENADGLQHEWLPLNAAIEKMETCRPSSLLGQFIKERDLFLLETFAGRLRH